MARNKITREMLVVECEFLRDQNVRLRQAAVSAAAMLQDSGMAGPPVRAVLEVLEGLHAHKIEGDTENEEVQE